MCHDGSAEGSAVSGEFPGRIGTLPFRVEQSETRLLNNNRSSVVYRSRVQKVRSRDRVKGPMQQCSWIK